MLPRSFDRNHEVRDHFGRDKSPAVTRRGGLIRSAGSESAQNRNATSLTECDTIVDESIELIALVSLTFHGWVSVMRNISVAILLVQVIVSAALLAAGIASAQVPPHVPGSICFTPSFWCWASQPGIPGQTCKCTDSSGYLVNGRFG